MREPRNTQNTRKNGEVGSGNFNAEAQRRRGWEVRKLKFTFTERKQKGFPSLPLLAATQNHGVILKSKYENRTVEATKALDTLKIVEIGDFVISLRSFQGGLEMAYDRGIISPAYTILTPTHITREYFKYYAKSPSFIALLKSTVTGIREGQNIDYNRLRDYYIEIPPVHEQLSIGAYLDAETGRIDKAIAAEEKMIALLQERREIVINEAVGGSGSESWKCGSEGIDFNAEAQRRRDWEVRRFKNLFSTCTGISFTKAELVEEGAPVLSYGQIHSKDNPSVGVNRKLIRHIPAALTAEKFLAYKGDFLFADTSEDLEGCGNCICLDTDEPIYAGSHVILARKRHEQIGRFLAYEFASASWRKQLRKHVNGVKVYSVTQTILNSVSVWLPSLSEQKEIVKYLDAETGKIDRAIEVKRRQIELLRERRQIVIDEAVTGKVKVA